MLPPGYLSPLLELLSEWSSSAQRAACALELSQALVHLPQARWRALGPQGPLQLPCPISLSAAGVPQPSDRGPPGAEAQRGAVVWVEWVGSMLMLMLLMMMMMAVVVVMMMVEDEEEEEEEEEERSQPPVCYE